MLPVFDANGVPVAHLVWMKGEELRRECESDYLVRDASLSNPGLVERALMRLGQFLMHTGRHLYEEYTASHPAYVITSSKYAA